ncbi:MAG: hypothetical protein HY952_10475 [Elusimicrobia bacterium]|nr:hypothetical protein [Elusimicrobiota bacterium]
MTPRMRRAFRVFPAQYLRLLRRLDSPRKVQAFLDYELAYNDSKKNTCYSPLEALRRGRAHCIEGAMLAAAAFQFHGRRALLLDLRANPKDDDHVIAPFTQNGRWGAVAMSHFCGLRYREPVYRSYGELARSYFDFYYNGRGEKTLREYSMPLPVSALPEEWLYSARDVFFVGRRLDAARHFNILAPGQERTLARADSLLVEAELVGKNKAPLAKRRPKPYSRLKLPRVSGPA